MALGLESTCCICGDNGSSFPEIKVFRAISFTTAFLVVVDSCARVILRGHKPHQSSSAGHRTDAGTQGLLWSVAVYQEKACCTLPPSSLVGLGHTAIINQNTSLPCLDYSWKLFFQWCSNGLGRSCKKKLTWQLPWDTSFELAPPGKSLGISPAIFTNGSKALPTASLRGLLIPHPFSPELHTVCWNPRKSAQSPALVGHLPSLPASHLHPPPLP